MGQIRRINFWFGGVVAPTLSQIVRWVLKPDEKMAAIGITHPWVCGHSSSVSTDVFLQLFNLEKKLIIGSISPNDFCKKCIEALGLELPEVELINSISLNIPIRPDVYSLLSVLASKFHLGLICDYPPDWYQRIASKNNLETFFPKERVIFTTEFQATEPYFDLLKKMLFLGSIMPEESLLIDANPNRNRAAIFLSINVSTFVDIRRLRRDLVLWGLL